MGINLRELQHFTITDLSGGVNEFASTYKVADNELIVGENISLKDSGGLKTRLGDKILDRNQTVTGGVRNMHRYINRENRRITLLFDEHGWLWGDPTTENYFEKITVPPYDSFIGGVYGRCRFTQYLDTAIMATDLDGPYLYNPDEAENSLGRLQVVSKFTDRPFGNSGTVSTTGGKIDAGDTPPTYYYYRFTFDYNYGDFMGESSPLYRYEFPPLSVLVFNSCWATISTGSTNKVQLKRGFQSSDLPSGVSRISIYRSGPYTTPKHDVGFDSEDYNTENYECFYIGSVEADDFNSAYAGALLFEDTGQAPGRLLEYNKMEVPPKGQFIEMHKGRVCIANVRYGLGSIESWANVDTQSFNESIYPHRLMISSVSNSGNFEPAVFFTDQFIDIDPRGSGITAMKSYKNEILVIFKQNSMWAVVGDDPHPQTGNIIIRNISNSVGCIAPESICEVEGRLVWLSNSGVYYWDGGSNPSPLKTDNIVDTIQGIPTTVRKDVAATYDRKQRELLVAHAGTGTNNKNTKIAKFDLRTSAWSVDTYSSGIGNFLSVDESDEETKTYAGYNDTSGVRFLYGPLAELNTGTSTNYYYIPPIPPDTSGSWLGEPISFEFQTKFFDGGLPYVDKQFRAVLFDIKIPEELTLHVLCDDHLDTRNSAYAHSETGAEGFTIGFPDQTSLVWAGSTSTSEPVGRRWYNQTTDDPPPGGNQILNTNTWASLKRGSSIVMLDDRCWGKRISLVVSGDVQDEVSLDQITVFYKPKETTRLG